MKKIQNKTPFSKAVMGATGEIEFQFTNDAMFKLVLQDNERVLKGLISSMLHIPELEIYELKVENPIVPGEGVNEKTFILDIKVLLNNNMIINLEMQLLDCQNWQNRSLSYLCRNFDNLQKGEDYISAKPVIHIGFLDFDLFEGDKEFYSLYRMLNVKNNKEYNGNFGINVLYLNRIEMATEDDKTWKIDEWARLFKAKTWEDIRMIAEKNEAMVCAVETMFEKQSDDMAREIMRRKQDEINHQRRMSKEREKMLAENVVLKNRNIDLKDENETLQSENESLQSENETLQSENETLQSENETLQSENESLQSENARLRAEIERLKG